MKNTDEFRNPQEKSAKASLPAPEISKFQPSRRELLQAVGAAGAATIAGNFALQDPLAMAQSSSHSPSSSTPKVNPFQDPSYAEGARQRIQQFIGGGADPDATKAIFAKLTSFDAEPWVAEWTKLAVPLEQKGTDLESQGKMVEANKAYEKASMYYGVARFPVINHPGKKAAYRKCIENFRKASPS